MFLIRYFACFVVNKYMYAKCFLKSKNREKSQVCFTFYKTVFVFKNNKTLSKVSFSSIFLSFFVVLQWWRYTYTEFVLQLEQLLNSLHVLVVLLFYEGNIQQWLLQIYRVQKDHQLLLLLLHQQLCQKKKYKNDFNTNMILEIYQRSPF